MTPPDETPRRKKVLLVDDSPVIRMALRRAVEADPELRVVGEASNGRQAVEKTHALAPDVIAMDFHMPDMNGIQATQQIMAERPTPIVIVSGLLDQEESTANFIALEAGALALVSKPRQAYDGEEYDHIVETLKAMSEVTVIRRRPHPSWKQSLQASAKPWDRRAVAPARRSPNGLSNGSPGPQPAASIDGRSASRTRSTAALPAMLDARRPEWLPRAKRGPFEVILLGASTGGPQALARILAACGERVRIPMVAVQHIAAGFLDGLVRWLDGVTPLQVRVAEHGAVLEPGCVYFAPDDRHLRLGGSRLLLDDAPPIGGLKPAVNALFESGAALGSRAAAALLTGMGKDGADGLCAMRKAGGLTIAQSEETCIVYGMPRAAVEACGADVILPLDDIAATIAALGARQ